MTKPADIMVAECRPGTMLEGEHLAEVAIERIAAGTSDTELILRLILGVQAIDGRLVPPGPALRACCARIQRAIEP